MSTAARRRYVVGFESWTKYQAIVLANSQREAITTGKARGRYPGKLGQACKAKGRCPCRAQGPLR